MENLPSHITENISIKNISKEDIINLSKEYFGLQNQSNRINLMIALLKLWNESPEKFTEYDFSEMQIQLFKVASDNNANFLSNFLSEL
jgi:hypothetical protein